MDQFSIVAYDAQRAAEKNKKWEMNVFESMSLSIAFGTGLDVYVDASRSGTLITSIACTRDRSQDENVVVCRH